MGHCIWLCNAFKGLTTLTRECCGQLPMQTCDIKRCRRREWEALADLRVMFINLNEYNNLGTWTVIMAAFLLGLRLRTRMVSSLSWPFQILLQSGHSRRGQPSRPLSLWLLLSLPFIPISNSTSCGSWAVQTTAQTMRTEQPLVMLWSFVQDCWMSIRHNSQKSGDLADHEKGQCCLFFFWLRENGSW